MKSTSPPSFSGLKEQYLAIKEEIDAAFGRVLASGWYVLGREVEAFESELAAYCGVDYAIGCASGTEAIALSLMALGVKEGDEVITVAHTAVPTATAISQIGARPVFVDVDQYLLMDTQRIESRITRRTKAILPVHLYGQMVEMDKVMAIAQRYHLHVVEDACQAHGAEYRDKKAGTWGDLGCFSFYPTKNLGCYGDGGAVVTDRKEFYDTLIMLRNYGQKTRYHHLLKGINSRLDEVQAAVLRVKLKYLAEWNDARQRVADWYTAALRDVCVCPAQRPECRHVYHLYVIRTSDRESLMAHLEAAGITTLIHYPLPVHLQEAFRDLGCQPGDLPQTELAAGQVLSLPMHPGLAPEEVTLVCDRIIGYYEKAALAQ